MTAGDGGSSVRAGVIAALRAGGCVFAEDEADVLMGAAHGDVLRELVARRVGGHPLETLVGWVDFRGLRLAVGTGVFVPRRRTELMVAEAVTLLAPGDILVDLCCGNGAVSAGVVDALPDTVIHATDIDPVAIGFAARNLGSGARTYTGDLFDPLPAALRGRIDVVVANVPYVPTGAIDHLPREARDHEPRAALDGGVDGLDVARRVLGEAGEWLRPGGHLLMETSPDQALVIGCEARRAGWSTRTAVDDAIDATCVDLTAPSNHSTP